MNTATPATYRSTHRDDYGRSCLTLIHGTTAVATRVKIPTRTAPLLGFTYMVRDHRIGQTFKFTSLRDANRALSGIEASI